MNLHFQRFGSARTRGVPLVILHGLFGSGDNWLPIARAFENEYRVILPDLPNHGDSPHTDRFTYPEMAEAIAEFLRVEELVPCILTGHSMGGKIAMATALENPGMVEKLCLVDIAPKADNSRHTQMLAAMQEVAEANVRSRRDAESILERRIPGKRERAFLQKSLVQQDDGIYRWKLNLDLIRGSYETMLGWPYEADRDVRPYDRPALFLGGARSQYLMPDDREVILSLFPRAQMVHIADAGHWVHADQPEEFMNIFRNFVNGAS